MPGTASEPGRVRACYLVRLWLLPGMSPERGLDELRRSIGFGQPEVTLVEDPDAQEP
jgi:hypothetical protein